MKNKRLLLSLCITLSSALALPPTRWGGAGALPAWAADREQEQDQVVGGFCKPYEKVHVREPVFEPGYERMYRFPEQRRPSRFRGAGGSGIGAGGAGHARKAATQFGQRAAVPQAEASAPASAAPAVTMVAGAPPTQSRRTPLLLLVVVLWGLFAVFAGLSIREYRSNSRWRRR